MAGKEEVSISVDNIRKNWHWIALIAILFLGLYFRSYHLDYPVIGYHNWKESRYLGEARNFAEEGFFRYGLFVASDDYPNANADPSGAHGGEFPTLSILIAVFFKILGESLLVARIIMLLIGLGIILMTYLLMKELFDRQDIALASAFASALMPMLVFFTHNTDVVSFGLLLMLIGAYLYVLWVKGNKGRDLVLSSFFVMLAAVSKYYFLIILLPMLFIFPLERLKDLKKFGPKAYPYIGAAIAALLLPAQYLYSGYISSKVGEAGITTKLIDISSIMTSQWWTILKAYTADNYTILGFWIAMFGIAFFFLFFKKKDIGYRFMLGYLVGLIPFVLVMSKKLSGHSYHQYAIAPLAAFLIAYCLVVAAANASKIVGIKYLKPFVIIVLFLILYFPSSTAWSRQFDTQFFGLDVAGEYIKANSAPDERIIHSGHQDFGVLWHADRKGIGTGVPSLDDIKYAESKLNAKWVFLYQWGFSVMKEPEKWQYIKDNYELKQIAFINNQPIYLLFKRGGRFDESMLQNLTGVPQKKIYELTSGTVEMQWVNFN